MSNPNDIIINSGYKFVATVSGGGQEIFGDLTKHGGMSQCLLEGIIPYSVPAFKKLIGGHVDQIVSPAAARAAAMVCYKRAREYQPNHHVFGFASTGSVIKAGTERLGRQHNVCMAIQNHDRTIGINITLHVKRTREEEESLVAKCIRQALIWGCSRFGDVKRVLHEDDEIKVDAILGLPNRVSLVHGEISKDSDTPSKAIFSSSCNPLHAGHLAMIEHASKQLGSPVDIELCIQNADKPPLDYLTIRERVEQTQDYTRGNPYVGRVILTNKPLFFDKVDLFPGAVFIVGTDTYDRILDVKYYGNSNNSWAVIDKNLEKMESLNSKFLVYPRKGYDVKVHYLPKMASFVSDFTASDISSTALRQELIHANN